MLTRYNGSMAQDRQEWLGLARDAYRLLEVLSPSEQAGAGRGSEPATTPLGRAIVGSRPLYAFDSSKDPEQEREHYFHDFGVPYYLNPEEAVTATAELRQVFLEGVARYKRLEEALNALQRFLGVAGEAGEYVVVWLNENGWMNASEWVKAA